MVDQLCTTAQVKARIFPAGGSDALDDALISELIDQVSDWIQDYTGRKFVAEVAATYVFDTEPGYVLYVPRGIRTITSMGVATTHQPDSGGTYTTIPAADRLLRPKAADIMDGSPPTEVHLNRGTLSGTIRQFVRADNGCTITGDFGFATVPPAVQAVAIDSVVIAYAQRKNGASGAIGAEDTSFPRWSQFFTRGSPQRQTLDRYAWQAVA